MDDYRIARMEGVTLKLHTLRREEVAIQLDLPWERTTHTYAHVFQDGDLYRMYFGCSSDKPGEYGYCYAESTDGVTWGKPLLGRETELWGATNIILTSPDIESLAPFLDTNPAASPDQRYKAIGGFDSPHVFVSPDGLHWVEIEAEFHPYLQGRWKPGGISAFWDAARETYVTYFRIQEDAPTLPEGILWKIGRMISDDFLTRERHAEIDLGDTPPEQLYTNSITPYFRALDILLGFPMRYLPERQVVEEHWRPGISDAVFMSSRDGVTFHRYMEAFQRPGPEPENWIEKGGYILGGIVETAPGELSVYYAQHWRQETGHL